MVDVVVVLASSQQSKPDGKADPQLFVPQVKPLWHSVFESQSPSPSTQGFELEQQAQPEIDAPQVPVEVLLEMVVVVEEFVVVIVALGSRQAQTVQ